MKPIQFALAVATLSASGTAMAQTSIDALSAQVQQVCGACSFLTLGGQPTGETARRILFITQHWGADGFNHAQLTAPRISTHRDTAGNRRFLNGQNARMWFRAYGVQGIATGAAPAGTRVFAGDYRDTVTLTITAN